MFVFRDTFINIDNVVAIDLVAGELRIHTINSMISLGPCSEPEFESLKFELRSVMGFRRRMAEIRALRDHEKDLVPEEPLA